MNNPKLSEEVVEITPEEINLLVSPVDQDSHRLVFKGVTYYINPEVISDVVITPDSLFVVYKS
jgi:hypothetical protein